MERVARAAAFMNKHLVLFVIGVAALAVAAPGVVMPLTKVRLAGFSLANVLLAVIMFGNGLSVDVSSFGQMARRPWQLLLGLALKYLCMAGGAALVARFFSDAPGLAFGIIMLGCMPSGTAAGVMVNIAGGDIALCMTLVLLSTFLAPVVTPALTLLLGGEWVSIDFWGMFQNIAIVVLVPMVVGILVRSRARGWADGVKPAMSLVTLVSILVIVAVCTAPNAAVILSLDSVRVILGVTANFVIAALVAILVTRLLRLEYPQMAAVQIASLQLNTALSSGIAATYADVYPSVTTPSIVAVVLNLLFMTLFVQLLVRWRDQGVAKADAEVGA